MNLIITNEQLTALLPNVAVTVQGEVPLINKLTPFLNAAENWVSDTFLSSAQLQENMNTQIRALTGGDITKERDVLRMDCWRALRSEVQSGQYRSMLHQKVCRILQAVEIRCLQSTDPTAWMHFEHGSLFNLVNTIRENPEEFPEWHSSATAQLYDPAVFENKKDSLGYWF